MILLKAIHLCFILFLGVGCIHDIITELRDKEATGTMMLVTLLECILISMFVYCY